MGRARRPIEVAVAEEDEEEQESSSGNEEDDLIGNDQGDVSEDEAGTEEPGQEAPVAAPGKKHITLALGTKELVCHVSQIRSCN